MSLGQNTALLSKGASLKLLCDMLQQAENEKAELLTALRQLLAAYEGDAGDDSEARAAAHAVIAKLDTGTS